MLNHWGCKMILKRVVIPILFGVLFTFAVVQNGFAQNVIKGTIVNSQGEPLHLAHVMIKDAAIGDVSDENGRFHFKTDTTGNITIFSSLVGYQTIKKQIKLHQNDQVELQFQMYIESTSLGEATVTRTAFTTGDERGVTLSPTEVVTTPGAAADIFRTLKTFPGISNIDEGSGLFVRGGDVSEVSFILDQASVVHPYKYETPTGGVFGTISPFLVSGTYFSTGGFSAKYGNALSAVLAMESKGMPDGTQLNSNIGMAALSAGGEVPIIPGKLGVHFSGNRSLSKLMFDVNGLADEFEQPPVGGDANFSLIAKPYQGTTIKLFNYVNTSRVGVRVPQPSFQGTFESEEQNRLHNLQWKQLWGSWFVKTSFSINRYQKEQEFGGLDLDEEDRTYKVRSDVEFSGWENVRWYAGLEWERNGKQFLGQVPGNEMVLNPSAYFQSLNDNFTTQRLGGYLETEYQVGSHWKFRMGVRSDYENRSQDWTVDPRFSMQYKLSEFSTLRLASGTYHQYAEPFQYNSVTGNPDLDAQQARHYIAGYEFKKGLFHLRTEGYYKSYDDLIIEDGSQNLDNIGYGKAYGADFFFKYSDFMRSPFNGWVSYSFLRSNRYQSKRTATGITHEYGSSSFDIRHNVNAVAKMKLVGMLTGGVTYRYSTGRPFTPVIDAQPTRSEYFIPIEGPINSQRLPDFHRLDVNLSYYWVPTKDWSVIFYTSVSNLLNRKNVMDYTYNNDYSQRRSIYSDYRRFFYAGVTLTLNL